MSGEMRRLNVPGERDFDEALCREVEDLRLTTNTFREGLQSVRCDLIEILEMVESLAISLECVERSLRSEVLKAKACTSLLVRIEPGRVGVE